MAELCGIEVRQQTQCVKISPEMLSEDIGPFFRGEIKFLFFCEMSI